MSDNTETQPFLKISLDSSFSVLFKNPARFLLVILLLTAWAEIIVMIIISFLPPMTIMAEALIDALLLSVIILPTSYFLIFRPLKLHMGKNEKMRTELREYRFNFNQLIKERTSEIIDANEHLQEELKKLESELIKYKKSLD